MLDWPLILAQDFSDWAFNGPPVRVSTPEFDGAAGLAAFALVVSIALVLYDKSRR